MAKKVSWDEVFARMDIVGGFVQENRAATVARGKIGSVEKLEGGAWKINFEKHRQIGVYFEDFEKGWQKTSEFEIILNDHDNPAQQVLNGRINFKINLHYSGTIYPKNDPIEKNLFKIKVGKKGLGFFTL